MPARGSPETIRRALLWPSFIEALSRRVDRLPIRFAVLIGFFAGGALGFGLGLERWWSTWGVLGFLLVGAWVMPWALSGRPILRTRTRRRRFELLRPPTGARIRVVRFDAADEAVEIPMVDLPGGIFQMGGRRYDDEGPVHPVRLPPFSIMDVPVTQGLFDAVMELSGDDVDADPNIPASSVSWLTAIKFCNRASAWAELEPAYVIQGDEVTWRPEALGFRLPLEAEWEYAVRAGTAAEYFFGTQYRAGRFAWFGDTAPGPQPVRGKRPNDWGLYDMAGNVWEWCWDEYDTYDEHAEKMAAETFVVAGPVADRVARGGSFEFPATWLRSAYRFRVRPTDENSDFGFRCVLGARPAGWSFAP